MRGNFGLKLQNSPKLPHIHARFPCHANEKGKGLLVEQGTSSASQWNFRFSVSVISEGLQGSLQNGAT